jgi:hypothetical protein
MSKRKRILQAAKENIENEYRTRFEVLNEMYDRAIDAGDHELVATIVEEINGLQDAKAEQASRAKKNKKKIGKRVTYVAQREQRRSLPKKDHAALAEFKANRKEQQKATIGAHWLYEGALVVRRGKSDMMIVTRVAGNKVECLKNGTTQWFRGVSLRPADWLMED